MLRRLSWAAYFFFLPSSYISFSGLGWFIIALNKLRFPGSTTRHLPIPVHTYPLFLCCNSNVTLTIRLLAWLRKGTKRTEIESDDGTTELWKSKCLPDLQGTTHQNQWTAWGTGGQRAWWCFVCVGHWIYRKYKVSREFTLRSSWSNDFVALNTESSVHSPWFSPLN